MTVTPYDNVTLASGIWTAAATFEEKSGDSSIVGWDSAGSFPGATLSDTSFALGSPSVTYTVTTIQGYGASGTSTTIGFGTSSPALTKAAAAGHNLHVGDLLLDFDDATDVSGGVIWTVSSGVSGTPFTDGNSVNVRITKGSSRAANSAATGALAVTDNIADPATANDPTHLVTYYEVGTPLTADRSAIADANGLPANDSDYAWQWLRDGAAISGATSNTYTPQTADLDKRLSVRLTFTDDAGYTEVVTGDEGTPVEPAAEYVEARWTEESLAVRVREGGTARLEAVVRTLNSRHPKTIFSGTPGLLINSQSAPTLAGVGLATSRADYLVIDRFADIDLASADWRQVRRDGRMVWELVVAAPDAHALSDSRLEGDERFLVHLGRGHSHQGKVQVSSAHRLAEVTIEDATAPPALQVRLSDSAIDVGDEATVTFLAPGGGLTWGGFPVTFAMHPEVSPDPRLTGKAAADEDNFEIRVDGTKVDRRADGTWRAELGSRDFDSAGPVTVSVFNREDRRAEGAKLLVLVPDAGRARLLRDGGTQFREWVLILEDSGISMQQAPPVLPGAPSVSAAPGDGSVTLTWTGPAYEGTITGWELRHGAADAEGGAPDWGEWTALEDATAETAQHTVTGLENGTEYAFELRAMVGEFAGAASATVRATPVVAVPGPPELQAEAGAGSVRLRWLQPGYEGTLTGWELRWGAVGADDDDEPDWGEWTAIAGATAETVTHTVTGLEAGTTYAFELRAMVGEVAGEASATAEATVSATVKATVSAPAETAVTPVEGTEVPADWGLLPEGVGPGEGFRLLVVTSKSRSAGESGIAAYDGHARSLAAAGHAAIREHGSKFRALVCTASVDARDHTGTTGAGVPVYWLGGDKVADGYADLYDGSWDSNAPRDERGEAVPGSTVRVFTGCASDGTGEDGRELGNGWRVAIGRAKVAGKELNDPGTTTVRSLSRRIYALSPVFVRADEALTPRLTGSVPDAKADGDGSRSGDGRQAGDGCRVDVGVRFVDGAGEAAALTGGLSASDFTVAGGRVGTPVADDDGLGWTVPAWSTAGFTGLMRVGLAQGERWSAGEQAFRVTGDAACAPAARGELASLGLGALALAPAFAGDTTSYKSQASADTSQVTVAASPVYGSSSVSIDPKDADAETAGHQVALAEGANAVTVTVTPPAGGGAAKKVYTVTVTRAAAPVAVVPRIDGIEVPADWALLPADVGPGEGFRLLVVTSQSRTAEATGIASYDGHARSLAGAGHAAIREHGSKFRALACTQDVDAREHTGTTGAGVPVYWLGGDKVADGYADLYDGSWASHAPRDERGEAVPGRTVRVFTGCAGDGTGKDGLELGTSGRIAIGRAKVSGVELNDPGTTTERQLSRRIYALSPVFVRAGAASAGTLSVADARAEEGTDATLDFVVTLDRSSTGTVTVDYATSDGSATAGDDYTATSGTLTFAAGESSKTVSVPVLDDAHDEGSETLTLTLSNASGATIADGVATGTITNSDPIPKAWLARFGRTVTGQVLDAVEARLQAPRAAGMEARLAGQALPSWRGGAANDDGAGDDAALQARADADDRAALLAMTSWLAQADSDDRGREPESRALTGRDFVLGTSFALSGGSSEGGGFASLWGHGSVAGFGGREDDVAVDGEVTTGFLGADWASERWTAGLALGHSRGSGGYRKGGGCDADTGDHCAGDIEAVLTGLYPYAGMDLTGRLSVWAAAGHGSGEVTVLPEGRAAKSADLTMSMGAAGVRGTVLKPEGGAGLALALKADTRFTRTSSDAVRGDAGNLEAADAEVWLVRAGLEGSRRFALGAGEGASVTPSFELALRRDGGDAETGLGADIGAGVAFADTARGLGFEARARGLVAHEAEGFREWGANVAFGFDPRPETDRGLSLTLTQSWGASPSGGMDALLGRETLAGLAANDDGGGGFEASSRLEGELGYGVAAFGGGFTGTPNVGFGLSDGGARDWRVGWRLGPAGAGALDFELNLDATRREPANDEAPEHGVMLRAGIRW